MFNPLTPYFRKKHFNRALQLYPQWLEPKPEEVVSVQLNRLRQIWKDATVNVPYYRRLIGEGKAPRNFDSLHEFFEEVPVLTREQIAAHPELFKRIHGKPDGIAMTAGSTGNPIHFGFYKKENEFSRTSLWVGRIANGMEINDRIFLLWGHSHLLGTGLKGWVNHLIRRTKDRLLGYYRSDAYHLDRESARWHVRALLKFKPQILIGYSNALDILVRHNQDLKNQARELGLKFVVATAEVLPRPDSRWTIEDFFNCPLVMEYGGVEFGAVAHNRPNEPYRVYWWDCLVEISEEPGTAAPDSRPIAVTPLYPRYLPLVRYRTGDEIRGDIFSLNGAVMRFAEVCGRHHDVVKLNDGSSIHSVALFHCIHQESQVYNIQLVIEPAGMRLLLVGGSHDPEIIQRIRHRLRDLNGSLRSCKIEFVPDLIANRAGKRRWIVDRRQTHA